MRKVLIIILLLVSSSAAFCQSPRTYTSSEILSQIKRLNVLGSVLYIAAHPDDENTRLLAYLANDKLYRTGYLSLTRGDGGQNLIGDEQGVELGLIRTHELLSARRIDGAEQFFSRAYDFGFSKNPEETFKVWDKEKILSDVVWVIRKFQPDVIITRFPTTGEGGHGHHTASAILASEAFDAAADPNRFPEQFKYGVKPWKTKRLLWNTFNFGSTNTQREDQLKFDVGGYNSLLGKSYGEIAAESRSQHKSQGFGVPKSRGVQLEYFKTIKGDAPLHALTDGIDESWMRINPAGTDKDMRATINSLVDNAVTTYSVEHPEYSIPALVNIYKIISGLQLQDDYWKKVKLSELTRLIEACSGLFLEATTQQQYVVPGDSLKINVLVNNRLGIKATYPRIHFGDSYMMMAGELNPNTNLRQAISWLIPADTQLTTQPYWLVNPLDRGNFVVNNQELIGKPENDHPSIRFELAIEGQTIPFTKPIQYKTNDPVRGELYQPLVILPAVEVKYDSRSYLSMNKTPVAVKLKATVNSSQSGNIILKNMHSPNIKSVNEASAGHELNSFMSSSLSDYKENIKGVAINGKNSWGSYRRMIQYDHIPSIVYFPPAEATLIAIDLKTSGSNIGYIPGAGDKIPEALEQMGYTVTILQQKDITATSLKRFDAIVTGVRAYNIHDWLSNEYDVLMNYIKEGGVMIVQYNVNGLRAKIGPYPFTVSGNRITDEEATVNFLLPEHPVLNFPNKITSKDFEGWIQERSTYDAEGIDPNYQAIFSMKDPGENEQKGALIVGDYGKGRFVYSGLVFFRELPAGIPGAYRLFANLLAKRQMTNKGSLNR